MWYGSRSSIPTTSTKIRCSISTGAGMKNTTRRAPSSAIRSICLVQRRAGIHLQLLRVGVMGKEQRDALPRLYNKKFVRKN